MVSEEILQINKVGSQTLCPVRGTTSRSTRDVGGNCSTDLGEGPDPIDPSASHRAKESIPQEQGQESGRPGSQPTDKDPRFHQQQPGTRGGVRVPSGRVGGERGSSSSSPTRSSRCTESAVQDVKPGECIAAGDHALAKAECSRDSPTERQ